MQAKIDNIDEKERFLISWDQFIVIFRPKMIIQEVRHKHTSDAVYYLYHLMHKNVSWESYISNCHCRCLLCNIYIKHKFVKNIGKGDK